ncbi:F-box protein CPR1-like [Apium graveolens]|uniref:F-box protein CPR1-like n=1 Tax=Apium graveolens TaxID=4045 RepID=UPI003D7B708A
MALLQELIVEILCRVPVKPLLRFRCVSKDWCSTIDSNAFIRKHLKTALECNTGAGLIVNDQGGRCYVVDSESLDGEGDDFVAVPIKNPLMNLIHGAEFFGAAKGLGCVAKKEMNEILNVPSNVNFLLKWAVFARGALYWTASKNQGNGLETIFGFDLELEQFEEVPFPSVDKKFVNCNTRIMVPVGESLCIFDNYPNYSIDVWLMNKNGSENPWYKAFTVKQPSPLDFEFLRPLAFSKSQTVVLLQVGNTKLMWHDLEKKTFKNVRIRGIPMNFYAYHYTESLLELADDPLQKPLQDKPLQKPSQDNQQKKQKKKRYKMSSHLIHVVDMNETIS